MAEPMIRVEGLVKRYGPRTAVGGLSFAVEAGEIFGLLGPNGAGKSTTLSMLATLFAPDEGTIAIAGFDAAREPARVRPLVGFVPQELALYPTLSARDNLVFFGRIYGLHGKDLDVRVASVLDLVGLRERAADPVRTFSGGMMRRLNLAAGLVHGPQLLFLDEPTVGVDPQSRNFIFEHVLELRKQGMTIVYTSHYMEEVERLCDRAAILDEGRLLALDAPKRLIQELGEGLLVVGLSGDAVATLGSSVEALRDVGKVALRDGKLHIETKNADKALLELLDLCGGRGIRLTSLEVLEPSLESVFLRLTGKRLRD